MYAQLNVMQDRCLDCFNVNTLVEKQREGTLVCMACGFVMQHGMIDQTNEKRDYASEGAGADHSGNRVQHCGNPYLSQQGQQIVIEGGSIAANKLKRYMLFSRSSVERDLYSGEKKIRMLLECLNLNHADVKLSANRLLKRIVEGQMLKFKNLDVKVACAVFYAAQNTRKHKSVLQILNYVHSKKHILDRCIGKLVELTEHHPVTATHIVETVCLKYDYSPSILRAAKITADNFYSLALCEGKRPQSIAGAALLMVLPFA